MDFFHLGMVAIKQRAVGGKFVADLLITSAHGQESGLDGAEHADGYSAWLLFLSRSAGGNLGSVSAQTHAAPAASMGISTVAKQQYAIVAFALANKVEVGRNQQRSRLCHG